jgi:fructoselysine-6-P-deglycase FrlB-like protein/sugar/nucleoside kinase (ribokinase family)
MVEEKSMQAAAREGAPRPRVIIVGNLTIDDIVLPDGSTRMGCLGGNCLYAALSARLWQPRVGVVTRRGEDFPRDLRALLARLQLASEGVVEIAGPTVRNWVIYEADGSRQWVYRTPRERSRAVAVRPEDLPSFWLEGAPAPVVHVAAMPLEAAEAIVEHVRRLAPEARITLDTHEDYVAGYRRRLLALAARVEAFLPSRAELADLVGYDEPLRALEELASLPTPIIVVKMGAEGVLIWDRRREQLAALSPVPGPVVDVTGAGDAFCGGFAAGLSLADDALEAAQRGMVSAAYCIGGFGSLHLAYIESRDAVRRLRFDPPSVRFLPTPSPPSVSQNAGAVQRISSEVAVMRQEIALIPDLLAGQLQQLRAPLQALAERLQAAGCEHLYLVGCGDSAFAGAAATLAFQKQAGLDAQGVQALDLARYRVRYLPRGSAVLCISFSGKVGRTIEAAYQARRFGHRVIALTGGPDTPLAQAADEVIPLAVPTLGYAPGTSTYLALLAALLQLAALWGTLHGRDGSAAQRVLEELPALARRTLMESEVPAREVAEAFKAHPWITFLGSGPNLATACFGAAKLLEGPQKLAVASDIEEWAHEYYFVSRAGTPVVLIAPQGAAFDRACEILEEQRFIGAETVLIGAVPPAGRARAVLPLPPDLPEEFSPLLAALPLSLLAFYLTQASGQERFEFADARTAEEHYETIHRVTKGEPA